MIVTRKNGEILDSNKYLWDEDNNIFVSNESGLDLNFEDYDGIAFKIKDNCGVLTGNNCTFISGSDCNFVTGNNCNFKTEDHCTFETGDLCTFDTEYYCNFDTGEYCYFTSAEYCYFKTRNNCIFNIMNNCIFETLYECVIIRRDIFEVIHIPKNKKIKLNGFEVKGYEIIQTDVEKAISLLESKGILKNGKILSL